MSGKVTLEELQTASVLLERGGDNSGEWSNLYVSRGGHFVCVARQGPGQSHWGRAAVGGIGADSFLSVQASGGTLEILRSFPTPPTLDELAAKAGASVVELSSDLGRLVFAQMEDGDWASANGYAVDRSLEEWADKLGLDRSTFTPLVPDPNWNKESAE